MAISEGKVLGDWLKWEVDGGQHAYCRKVVTLLAGSGSDRTITTGMVVGKKTSGGKYVQFDDTANTGEEDAAGIAIPNSTTAVDGTDNTDFLILARGPAVVSKAMLVWPSSADASEKAAAIVQLEALGIQVREGV
jgi:hypothetical protein